MVTRAPQTADKFIVRLPDGMRDRLSAAARSNGRSMTAELVHRLEASFAQDETAGVPDFSVSYRLDELEKRVADLEAKQ